MNNFGKCKDFFFGDRDVMLNVLCLWIFIFIWMRELNFEKKMCIKVIMLNDFRLRWNGDIWLFFFDKVMFLYRYFLLFVYM